jgi:hypothetical protein
MHVKDFQIGDLIVVNNGSTDNTTYMVFDVSTWDISVFNLKEQRRQVMVQDETSNTIYVVLSVLPLLTTIKSPIWKSLTCMIGLSSRT